MENMEARLFQMRTFKTVLPGSIYLIRMFHIHVNT